MHSKTKKLLCINTSPARQEAYAKLADTMGLHFIPCPDEETWAGLCKQPDPLVLLLVSHDAASDEGFRAIAHFRLSPFHAGLPIALIQSERDGQAAKQAMDVGATEIFLQSEEKALLDFISDCVAQSSLPHFAGKALLVEDDASHAEYVATLCNTMGFHVKTVDQVELAIEALQNENFQIVITDVVLNGTKSGIFLLRHIRQTYGAQLPVIVTSGFDDLPRRLMALKNGVGDFISKPIAAEEFIWRVQRVMQIAASVETGQSSLSPSHSIRGDLFNLLSPREYEICISMVKGSSDKEIAANLGISYWTVRTHVQQIFAKTGAINRRELMARYILATADGS